jgi:hypothetical protein
VNEVFPSADLLREALATASNIARNEPIAVRQPKLSIHRGLQSSLRDGLALEIEAYNRMVPTEDRAEGVLAFNEKRRSGQKAVRKTCQKTNDLVALFAYALDLAFFLSVHLLHRRILVGLTRGLRGRGGWAGVWNGGLVRWRLRRARCGSVR